MACAASLPPSARYDLRAGLSQPHIRDYASRPSPTPEPRLAPRTLSGLSTCARFPLSPRIQTLRAILAGACRRALAGAEGVCAAALHPSAKAPLRLVSSMPVLPRPERLSLHDAINYVAERCQSETEKAGKAVLAALSEGALAASANVLVSDRSYLPGVVAGPLPVGPPRRVDAGTGPVPPELWAGYPWPDFLRRAVLPRGNPMYRKQTADGHGVGPVYSDPMIATTDIDGWLERDGGSHKVPASRVGEEKRPIGTIHEAKQGLDLTPQQIMEKIAKRLIPLRPGTQNLVAARASGMLEQITNTTASSGRDDRLSALLARVPTALWRRGGVRSIPCRSALA